MNSKLRVIISVVYLLELWASNQWEGDSGGLIVRNSQIEMNAAFCALENWWLAPVTGTLLFCIQYSIN